MIDNFLSMAFLMSDKLNKDEFYFLQIIKRRKDNPSLRSNSIDIEHMFISNYNNLLDRKEEIVEYCTINNARAYLNLNRRSYKKVALQTSHLISANLISGNYNIKNCYLSCCGKHHSEKDKKWLFDIDWDEYPGIDRDKFISELVTFTQKLVYETGKDDTIHFIPTKNGEHLIMRPFNKAKFKLKYPNIDIKTNNPTLLFSL